VVKRCKFCGRYFIPDKRVGDRQKACSRKECQRASKQLAQSNWVKKNPGYFKGRYKYLKEWRAKRKEAKKEVNKEKKNMIQEEIPSKKRLYKLVFLVPGGVAEDMIQDIVIFKRYNRRTFVHYG
jgi:hypothetical protein